MVNPCRDQSVVSVAEEPSRAAAGGERAPAAWVVCAASGRARGKAEVVQVDDDIGLTPFFSSVCRMTSA